MPGSRLGSDRLPSCFRVIFRGVSTANRCQDGNPRFDGEPRWDQCAKPGRSSSFREEPTIYFPRCCSSMRPVPGDWHGTLSRQIAIDEHLPKMVEAAISFIECHTRQGAEIGRLRRTDLPEYPVQAVREAIINAVVHTDYALGGMDIKVAAFNNRLEISNPGFLRFGLTLEAALSGVSRLRNRVIGRVFRELKLIEQWGSGNGADDLRLHRKGFTTPSL